MDQTKMQFLQQVLRYSTQHTTPAEAEQQQQQQQQQAMSAEKKEWLDNALNNMNVSPLEEMTKCLNMVMDVRSPLDRRLEAISCLKDWCEDINFANDLAKINGYPLIVSLLLGNGENEPQIRAAACELAAVCAQNNPICQQGLLDFDNSRLLPLLIERLCYDPDQQVKIKALYAVSCLTRDFEPGQQRLLTFGGRPLDTLIRAGLVSAPNTKIKIKFCFLIASICQNRQIKQKLTEKKLVEKLIDTYNKETATGTAPGDENTEKSQLMEQLLSAIRALLDENPSAVEQAKKMQQIDFKQILTARIEATKGQSAQDEERQMAEKMFTDFFQN